MESDKFLEATLELSLVSGDLETGVHRVVVAGWFKVAAGRL